MDGVVFHPALTKPDLLVLENLAADIRDRSAGDKPTQRRRRHAGQVETGTAVVADAEDEDEALSGTGMAYYMTPYTETS
jgi:hypothetical protein